MKDLIVLVADKNMEFTLKGVLEKIPMIENIREFDFNIITHSGHDPGVYNYAHEFLRNFSQYFRYSMAILDHEGSGQENLSREEAETRIEQKLAANGWNGSSCSIVISPELENWIWVNALQIHRAITWNQDQHIYNWLINNGWLNEGESKPNRPKEALESALRLSQIPRSSAIYYDIASQASYANCNDPAFQKFIETIKRWFG